MTEYPTEPCQAPNCGRQIIRALTETRLQHLAIDPEPCVDGNITLYVVAGIVRAAIHRNPGKMFGKTIYAPHSRTCPAGGKFARTGPNRLETR